MSQQEIRSTGRIAFKGLEGLRGWLAWLVVGGHVIQFSPLRAQSLFRAIGSLGSYSVSVFIVISGFVITNLVVSKRETYRAYIVRRALRIYPAYAVSLGLAFAFAVVYDANHASLALTGPQWRDIDAVTVAFFDAPVLHTLLHLSLLHGIVPSSLVPNAQYMLLPPAWSLSLEWQFYIVAPPLIAMIARRPILIVACVVTAQVGYAMGLFGTFLDSSLIFGAGWLFLLGIGSRLLFDAVPAFDRFPVAIAVAIGFIAVADRQQIPLVGWVLTMLYLRSAGGATALDGPIARYFGARSYSIYILHMPLIFFVNTAVYGIVRVTGPQAVVASIVMLVPILLLAAELSYRLVEKPAIAFGQRLGFEPRPAEQNW